MREGGVWGWWRGLGDVLGCEMEMKGWKGRSGVGRMFWPRTILLAGVWGGGNRGRGRGGWRYFDLEASDRIRIENPFFCAHLDLMFVSSAIKLVEIAHASSIQMITQVNPSALHLMQKTPLSHVRILAAKAQTISQVFVLFGGSVSSTLIHSCCQTRSQCQGFCSPRSYQPRTVSSHPQVPLIGNRTPTRTVPLGHSSSAQS